MPKFEQIALRFFQARNLPLVSHNKTAPGLLYRPDFVFRRDDRLVIVECDEWQHSRYCKTKERIREEKILLAYQQHTGLDPKIIRYDPQPVGERACVRASVVAEIVNRELYGLQHTPTILKMCQFVGKHKIIVY